MSRTAADPAPVHVAGYTQRFRSAYSEHDPEEYGTENTKPSLTDSSQQESCDINQIMAKYERHGIITHVNQYNGDYSDVTGAVDYHEALTIQRRAEQAFMTLPSKVREEFRNDPGAFLEAVDDPEQRPRLEELGLFSSRSPSLAEQAAEQQEAAQAAAGGAEAEPPAPAEKEGSGA